MSGPFKVEVKHKDLERLVTAEGRARLLNGLIKVAQNMLRQKVQTNDRLLPWFNLQNIYLRGISTPESVVVDSDKAVLTLLRPPGAGIDPNMLEEGTTAFSIKKAILNGEKAKKNGYVNVPFRHAPGLSVHAPMIPKNAFDYIVAEARKVATASAPGKRGVVARGPKFGPVGKQKTIGPKAGGGHSTGVYSGMEIVKSGKDTMYQTFRRVSDKSKAEWIHPGFSRLGLFEKVAEDLRKNISKYAEPMLKLLLGEK